MANIDSVMVFTGVATFSNKVILALFSEEEEEYGTCFTMEVDDKQYLITARHLAQKLNWNHAGTANMLVWHNDHEWMDCPVRLIGHGSDDIDISVMALDFQIGMSIVPAKPSSQVMCGQDVYFFGFPYMREINSRIQMRNIKGLPTPFVKKGIVSFLSAKDGKLFIDGHNNPGFSGGPVIFQELFSSEKIKWYSIAGVISACRGEKKPLMRKGKVLKSVYVEENAGIIVAYDIRFAVDIIKSKSKPLGFPVPPPISIGGQ